MLARLTRKDEVVIGVPFANRLNRKEKQIFGYMVNTLPMYIKLEGKMNFLEYCKLVDKKIFSYLKHQDAYLAELNLGITDFPNNMFTFYKDEAKLDIHGCQIEEIAYPTKYIMNDLSTIIIEKENMYIIDIQYNNYFSNINFENIYENLINQAILNYLVEDIQLLTPKEVTSVYKNINTYNPFNEKSNILMMFEKIVKENADKNAITFESNHYTYQELDIRSNQIADFFITEYPKQKFIAYSIQKDFDLICTIFGIMKSGKICVPIDFQNPNERKEYMLNNLDTALYIYEENNLRLQEGISTISKSRFLSRAENHNKNKPILNINEDDGVYMLYTSGTTGKPKGVIVNYKNITSLINEAKKKFDFNNTDVWTMFHSYSFDFSMWEMLACLLTGGRLVLIDPIISKSMEEYYKLVCQEKVTILNLTPTAFFDFEKNDFKSNMSLFLRYIFLGGEEVKFHTLDKWVKKHSLEKTKIINLYGITETTIIVTTYEITETDIRDSNSSVIGKPLSNFEVFIIDGEQRILPKGVVGEIVIAGDGVTNGYYNNDNLTKEKFIYHPVIESRVYLSGDLGRVNKNNEIEYFGRLDHQIQIRGFRVELGEIEKQILTQDNIEQCVVGVKKEGGFEKLVAFVVAKNSSIDEKSIKSVLKKFIPRYMIPAKIITVDSIPKNINGKIDIKKLLSSFHEEKILKKFEDTIIDELYHMISNISGIDEFDENDNLFDIGITSLHIPYIHNKIIDKYGIVDFKMVEMFEYTTMSKLSDFIKSKKI